MSRTDKDLVLTALELAADLRRLADRVHDTHGRLLAGDLRRAAITVEETYQHLAPSAEPRRQRVEAPDGRDLELGYPQVEK